MNLEIQYMKRLFALGLITIQKFCCEFSITTEVKLAPLDVLTISRQ